LLLCAIPDNAEAAEPSLVFYSSNIAGQPDKIFALSVLNTAMPWAFSQQRSKAKHIRLGADVSVISAQRASQSPGMKPFFN
jgi:hypothetical protein